MDFSQTLIGLEIDLLAQVFGVQGIPGKSQANPEDGFLIGHHFLEELGSISRRHHLSFIHEERRPGK
jgi:hypothetical protein